MPEFHKVSEIALPAEAVWSFHAQPGAFQRLMPPWQRLEIRSWRGSLADAQLRFVIRQGPARLTWLAQHDAAGFVDGHQFVDVMLKGPASRWRHTHRVNSRSSHACELDDRIDYALPLHPVSDWVGGAKFRSDLERLFAFRHARTMHDAWRHARYAAEPRKRIVLTGSNGAIGSALLAYLLNAGHTVDRLVRSSPRPTGDGTPLLPGREIQWDPTAATPNSALINALNGCDAVVHLGAASLAEQRWTEAFKRTLVASRVQSTSLLARAIAACANPPETLLVASGANYYQPAAPGDLSPRGEHASAGDGFLAKLASDWENAAQPARGACRAANLRLGVVLTRAGGFLKSVSGGAQPLGVGISRFGRPDSIVPWVHIDDAIAAIEHIIHTPSLSGPINIAAPAVDSHAAVMAAINRAAGAWATIPLPAAFLRAIAGEVADHAFASQPVSSAKLQASGFHFAVPSIDTAAGIEFGSLASLRQHTAAMQLILKTHHAP